MEAINLTNKLKREYRKGWFSKLDSLGKVWFGVKVVATAYGIFIAVQLVNLMIRAA